MNSGKACPKWLNETGPCDSGMSTPWEPECPIPNGQIKRDCTWQEWEDWSSCNECGGIMYRGRQVKQHAQMGGKNCTESLSQETKTCNKKCYAEVHCAWATWEAWSDCDITCVPAERKGLSYGKRTRKRTLEVVAGPSPSHQLYEAASSEDVQGQVQELYRRTQNADSRRTQEVSAAFAFGSLSFLVGYAVLSRMGGGRSSHASRSLSRQTESAEDLAQREELQAALEIDDSGRRRTLI